MSLRPRPLTDREKLYKQALANKEADIKRLRSLVSSLRKHLKRAVYKNGHTYHCSAARGVESDCWCGWVETREAAGQPTKDNSMEVL